MKLVKETFKRSSHFDLYHTVIEMINNRPLSLTTHPHIREAMGNTKEVVTPFSLFYGFKPDYQPLLKMTDQLDEESRERYIARWQNIMSEHDRLLQQELEDRNKNFKPPEGIQVGDLVLMVNKTAHKEALKYYRNLYEVKKIYKARYMLSPLFGGSTGLVQCNANDIKPYSYSGLFELLPQDIRFLMGESLTPEQLKNMKTNNNKDMPKDFQDWGLLRLPPGMKLRNRLTPASLMSAPAVKFSNTYTYSGPSTKTKSSSSSSDYGHGPGSSSTSSGDSDSSQGRPGRPPIRVPNLVVRNVAQITPPEFDTSRLGKPQVDPRSGAVRFDRASTITDTEETAWEIQTNVTGQTKTTGTSTFVNRNPWIERPLFTPPVVRKFPIARPVPRKQTPTPDRPSSRAGRRKEIKKLAARTPTPFPKIVTRPLLPPVTETSEGEVKTPSPPPKKEDTMVVSPPTRKDSPPRREDKQQPRHDDTSPGGIIDGAYGPSPGVTITHESSGQSEELFQTAESPEISMHNQTPSFEEPIVEPRENASLSPEWIPVRQPQQPDDTEDNNFSPPHTSSPKTKDGKENQTQKKEDVAPRPVSPKKKAVFADEKSKPIATDNDGFEWRRTKASEEGKKGDRTQPKHVPFDMPSETSHSPESQAQVKPEKSKKSSKDKKETSQFQDLVTTRTGRVVRQPDRLGVRNPQHEVQQPKQTNKAKRPGYDVVSRSPSATPPPVKQKRSKTPPEKHLFVLSSDEEDMREADESTDVDSGGESHTTGKQQKEDKPSRKVPSQDRQQTKTPLPTQKTERKSDKQEIKKSSKQTTNQSVVPPSPVPMTDMVDSTETSIAKPIAQANQGYFDPSIAGKRYVSSKPIVHTWTLPPQGSLMPVPVILPQPTPQAPQQVMYQPAQQPMVMVPEVQAQQIMGPSVGPQMGSQQQPTVPYGMPAQHPQQQRQLWEPPMPSPLRKQKPRPRSARDLPIDELLDSMDVIRIPRNYQEQDSISPPNQTVVSPPLNLIQLNPQINGQQPQQRLSPQQQMQMPMQLPQTQMVQVPMPAHLMQLPQTQPLDLTRYPSPQYVPAQMQPYGPMQQPTVVTTNVPTSMMPSVPMVTSQNQYVMPQPTSMVVSRPQPMNMVPQPLVTVAANNIPAQVPMQTIVNRPGPLPSSQSTSIQQPVVPMPGTRKRHPTEPASDTQANLLNPRRTVQEPPTHVQRIDPRSPTRQAPPVQQVQPMVVVPQPIAQVPAPAPVVVPASSHQNIAQQPQQPIVPAAQPVQIPVSVPSPVATRVDSNMPTLVLRKRHPTDPAGDSDVNLINRKRTVTEPPTRIPRMGEKVKVVDPPKPQPQADKIVKPEPPKSEPTPAQTPKVNQTTFPTLRLRKRPPGSPAADEPNILNPQRAVTEPDQKTKRTVTPPADDTKQPQVPDAEVPQPRTPSPQPGPSGMQFKKPQPSTSTAPVAPSAPANGPDNDLNDDSSDEQGRSLPHPSVTPRATTPVGDHENQLRALLNQRHSPSTDFGNGNSDQSGDSDGTNPNDYSQPIGPDFDVSVPRIDTDSDSPGTPPPRQPPVRDRKGVKRPPVRKVNQNNTTSDDSPSDNDSNQSDGQQPPAPPLRRSGRVSHPPDRLQYLPKPPKKKARPKLKKVPPKQPIRKPKKAVAAPQTDDDDDQTDDSQDSGNDQHQGPPAQGDSTDNDQDMGRPRRSTRIRKPPDRLGYGKQPRKPKKKKPNSPKSKQNQNSDSESTSS